MSKLDLTKPIQTRNGKAVRIVDTKVKGGPYSLLAVVDDGRTEIPSLYTQQGQYIEGVRSHSLDLVNVLVKHKKKVWVNVYPRGTCSYLDEASAKKYRCPDCIACVAVEVEFTEGEGL